MSGSPERLPAQADQVESFVRDSLDRYLGQVGDLDPRLDDGSGGVSVGEAVFELGIRFPPPSNQTLVGIAARLKQSFAATRRVFRVLGARDDLAHLGAFEGHRVGDVRPDPFYRGSSRVLGLEHDHRLTVASVVSASPVARNEAGRLRDPWYDLFGQRFLSALSVTDRDSHDDCVHAGPPIMRQGPASLRRAAYLVHPSPVLNVDFGAIARYLQRLVVEQSADATCGSARGKIGSVAAS
jgi:hypothetical protein